MICIVIVNWRGYVDTIECLESLSRASGPEFRIILIDNESDPAGVAAVADWASGRHEAAASSPPWRRLPAQRRRGPAMRISREGDAFRFADAPLVTFVPLQDNRGFAGANNVGFRAALSDPACDYVWLLNNDTIVDENALIELISRLSEDPKGGCCGSTVLYYDAPSVVQSLGGSYNPLRARTGNIGQGLRASELPPRAAVEIRLDYVMGVSMLVSREFIETTGPMYEAYFLYFEELDWSRRNDRRFTLCWAPGSRVYHKEGRSIGTSSRSRPSDTSLYYHNASYLRFTLRHDALLTPWAFLIVALKVVLARLKGDLDAANVCAMAIVDVVTRRRRTGKIETRKASQTARRRDAT